MSQPDNFWRDQFRMIYGGATQRKAERRARKGRYGSNAAARRDQKRGKRR